MRKLVTLCGLPVQMVETDDLPDGVVALFGDMSMRLTTGPDGRVTMGLVNPRAVARLIAPREIDRWDHE